MSTKTGETDGEPRTNNNDIFLSAKYVAIGEIITDKAPEIIRYTDLELICMYGVYIAKLYGLKTDPMESEVNEYGIYIPSVVDRVKGFNEHEIVTVQKSELQDTIPLTIEKLERVVHESKRLGDVLSLREKMGYIATTMHLINECECTRADAKRKMAKTMYNQHNPFLQSYLIYKDIR